jgi:hypothetical protein
VEEWDIGLYDECLQRGGTSGYCCGLSGGKLDSTQSKCVAPPAAMSPGSQGNLTGPVGGKREPHLGITGRSAVSSASRTQQ